MACRVVRITDPPEYSRPFFLGIFGECWVKSHLISLLETIGYQSDSIGCTVGYQYLFLGDSQPFCQYLFKGAGFRFRIIADEV